MKVRWNDVLNIPSNVFEEEGRRCQCGHIMPHENLELYDADGSLVPVRKVQVHGDMVRLYLDCNVSVSKVIN